jgi:cell division septation protein DedD/nucleoid DNA-binding protein
MFYICVMRLDPFITDLLYDHDCVILPEFGGMVANYRSARLNVISHVIQPPSKSIGFNPSLKYNDGLLTNYVSAALGMSYKDAAALVAQTIAEYQQMLAAEGRFSIDRIGVFYKDRFGQVQFIPEEQENFLMSSYGLKPIQLKLVGGMTNPDSSKIIPMNATNNRPWKVAAAILLPALLAGSWVLGSRVGKHDEMSFASMNPFGEPRKESVYAPVESSWDLSMTFSMPNYDYLLNNAESMPIDFVNGVVDSEGIELKARAHSQEAITPVEEKAEPGAVVQVAKVSEPKAKKTVSNSTSAYTLIGGAFQVKENGQRLIDQLRAQGYDAQFAGMRDNLHLVAYGHFSRREDAEAVKTKVQASGAKAWIRTNQ